MTDFWGWFIRGTGAGPGIRRFWNLWLIVHAILALIFSVILPTTLEKSSVGLLLPIASIFIGLTFAWSGNAQALLQSEEIEELAKHRSGGYEEYVYAFQAAILLILVTLVAWGVAGLGVFDHVWPTSQRVVPYRLTTAVLFFLASISLRECWHVVLGAQALLMMRFKIKQRNASGRAVGKKRRALLSRGTPRVPRSKRRLG